MFRLYAIFLSKMVKLFNYLRIIHIMRKNRKVYKGVIIIIYMPGINIYLDKKEDEIVNNLKKRWSCSKQDVIKFLIRKSKKDESKGDK